MNWHPVARVMERDVRRSRGLWAVVGLLAVVTVTAASLPALVIGGSLPAGQALAFLVAPLKVVVALTGLLAGYGAIAGARSGGQLTLMLGQPIERSALVVGAFVGRVPVVLGGVVVSLVVVLATLPVVYGELPLGRVAAFGALLALYAGSVTALAVGISAVADTHGRAAVAAVGAFVLFQFFWDVVPAGVYYAVEGSLPGPVVPPWVVLLERAQPLSAFEAATELAVPGVEDGIRLSPGDAQATSGGASHALADRLAGPPPAYLDPWAAVVTLVGWTALPLVVGWHRFQRADL